MYFCIIIAFFLEGCSKGASTLIVILENQQNIAEHIAALLNE